MRRKGTGCEWQQGARDLDLERSGVGDKKKAGCGMSVMTEESNKGETHET